MQVLFNRETLMFFRKIVSAFIVLTFLTSLIVSPAGAQVLPIINASQSATNAFAPPVLLGLKIHPENPLLFDFIVDQGQSKLSTEELKSETTKLVKYFLAALTIPDKEVWVNLSPTEKDRIIPDVLGQTTMGKTMLEQDYILKQLASSLTNPETDLGKKYWASVGNGRDRSLQNKVWIMPQKAEVLESNGIVLVGEKRLKVMLAEEYESNANQQKLSPPLVGGVRRGGDSDGAISPLPSPPHGGGGNKEAQTTSSQIFRATILPTIEKAVNEGKDFADVRQIYNSVILAAWYKKALKESLLGKIYADKGKVAGVETDDKQMKQRIYEQYLAAFKKGAYNLIKEETDDNGELIPRKYFSGGEALDASSVIEVQDGSKAEVKIEGVLSGSSQIIIAGTQLATQNNELRKLSAAASSAVDKRSSMSRRSTLNKKIDWYKWNIYLLALSARESVKFTSYQRASFPQKTKFTISGSLEAAFANESEGTIAWTQDEIELMNELYRLDPSIDNDKLEKLILNNIDAHPRVIAGFIITTGKNVAKYNSALRNLANYVFSELSKDRRTSFLVNYLHLSGQNDSDFQKFFDQLEDPVVMRKLLNELMRLIHEDIDDAAKKERQLVLQLTKAQKRSIADEINRHSIRYCTGGGCNYINHFLGNFKESIADALDSHFQVAVNISDGELKITVPAKSPEEFSVYILSFPDIEFHPHNGMAIVPEDFRFRLSVFPGEGKQVDESLISALESNLIEFIRGIDGIDENVLNKETSFSTPDSAAQVSSAAPASSPLDDKVKQILNVLAQEALRKLGEPKGISSFSEEFIRFVAGFIGYDYAIGYSWYVEETFASGEKGFRFDSGAPAPSVEHTLLNLDLLEDIGIHRAKLNSEGHTVLPVASEFVEAIESASNKFAASFNDSEKKKIKEAYVKRIRQMIYEQTASRAVQRILAAQDPILETDYRNFVMDFARWISPDGRRVLDADVEKIKLKIADIEKIDQQLGIILRQALKNLEVISQIDSIDNKQQLSVSYLHFLRQIIIILVNLQDAADQQTDLSENMAIYPLGRPLNFFQTPEIFDYPLNNNHSLQSSTTRFKARPVSLPDPQENAEKYLNGLSVGKVVNIDAFSKEYKLNLKTAEEILFNKDFRLLQEDGREWIKRLIASSGIGKQNDFIKGGIDFDPTNMNLQIKRDGRGVPLPLPQQNLEQINIQGLFPVIINIMPINAETLPIFLGQAPKEPAREPELAASTAS